jgi:sugar/nucleoside kinase (ribokinase family)
VEDWRRWAFMNDTIQLNEEEIHGLAVERLTEEQAAGHLLTLSVKGVIVTKGARGATLYFNDHKKLVESTVSGIQPLNARDSTGCGDVFGAAFHLMYVKSGNLLSAAEFANRVAAAKVEFTGVEGLKPLATVVAEYAPGKQKAAL